MSLFSLSHPKMRLRACRAFAQLKNENNICIRQSRSMSSVQSNIKKQRMNFFTAINDAMRVALQNDPTAIVFGEDVGFGGVFRYQSKALSTFPLHHFKIVQMFGWPSGRVWQTPSF
jgi:hypothetical protein